jgi:hypothetical protein
MHIFDNVMSSNLSEDPLERFFHRLVANLSALDPSALHRPIPVADIHERLVPYRTHRVALGFDSREDYEMMVLRLLAGDGGYALLFPEDVRDSMAREAASNNPDTGLFKQFPDATVLLEPEKIGNRESGIGNRGKAEKKPKEDEPRPIMQPTLPVADFPDSRPADPVEELPFSLEEEDAGEPVLPQSPSRPREVASISAPCSYCGANLPVGRTVLFCPHCGQNVGVVHCPTCGSELDVGWQFCIACGQKVTGIG